MEVKVTKITEERPELVEISCHKVTATVNDIVAFVKSRQGNVTGFIDDKEYSIPIVNIYYAEGVDNKVFLYSGKEVYESKMKLYELEEKLYRKEFLRISKSSIINLLKVDSIKPALNGRYLAVLKSGESIIISRKYVPMLKKRIMHSESEE